MMLTNKKLQESSGKLGYIAFTTFLIFSAVVLLAGATLSLMAVFEAQQSLAREKGYQTLYLAEGCASDALLSAFYSSSYAGGTRTAPEGSCTTTVSKVGNNWVLTSVATVSGYVRRVSVNILRSGSIQVLSWKDTE